MDKTCEHSETCGMEFCQPVIRDNVECPYYQKKLKPILFNTEMVRAILDGRKTVTRRLVKPQPEFREGETGTPERCDDGHWCFKIDQYRNTYEFDLKPPYDPGDVLYVRETFTKLYYVDPNGYTHWDQFMYYYAADGTPDITLVDGDGFEEDDQRIRWCPSIHMPKEIARIFLRVTKVWMERLQDITADECPMEGVWPLHAGTVGTRESFYKKSFAELWDSTIKKSDLPSCGWDANPYVWRIKFEKISKEEATK